MKLTRAALALICSSGAFVFACSSYSDSPDAPTPDAGVDSSMPASSSGNTGEGGSGGSSSGDSGPGNVTEGQPQWCGLDTAKPPPVGGTDACPADKNLPGCACPTLGAEAACWTGFRKNRQVGVCRDGRTKCVAGAGGNVWGPCDGEKLPDASPANDEAACACFATVKWKIANITPCVWKDDQGYFAYSTWLADGMSSPQGCGASDHLARNVQPMNAWSANTLTTDCPGSYKVCVRLRAGDWTNPSENDCVLGQSCVDAKNIGASTATALSALPPWNTADNVCAKQYAAAPETQTPGYAELTVTGKTTTCNAVASEPADKEHLFKRIPICPTICRKSDHAQDAVCVSCQLAAAE